MSTSEREDDVRRGVDDDDSHPAGEDGQRAVGDMGEGIEATLPDEDEPGNM